ncbi:MAG: hypothetical protein ACI85I_000809 [Arenicella sp.]|jgi:hypothetical protein
MNKVIDSKRKKMADKKIEISGINSLRAIGNGISHLKYEVFYTDFDSLIQFAGNKFLNKILDDSKGRISFCRTLKKHTLAEVADPARRLFIISIISFEE